MCVSPPPRFQMTWELKRVERLLVGPPTPTLSFPETNWLSKIYDKNIYDLLLLCRKTLKKRWQNLAGEDRWKEIKYDYKKITQFKNCDHLILFLLQQTAGGRLPTQPNLQFLNCPITVTNCPNCPFLAKSFCDERVVGHLVLHADLPSCEKKLWTETSFETGNFVRTFLHRLTCWLM